MIDCRNNSTKNALADEEHEVTCLVVGQNYEGYRLDVFLSEKIERSRSQIQKLIKDGLVSVRGLSSVKSSTRLQAGMEVMVRMPLNEALTLAPEDIEFEVLYEDEDLIIINKPAGLVVHPSPGHWKGTLVQGLLARYPDLFQGEKSLRPGIVHRLDAGTSGLMVVAKHVKAHERMSMLFKARSVAKEYLALAWGAPKNRTGLIDLPIGRDSRNRLRMAVTPKGKRAITRYQVLWTCNGFSFIRCRIYTGRTHQIRVHLKSLGCPLVGDKLYAPRRDPVFGSERIFLHAWRLAFPHPITGVNLSFQCYLTEELIAVLQDVFSNKLGRP
ncbi:MAG: RluA family pseudouridine synthase [Thermovirga sp.]|nr:RluA family pseudouridine synthase [Thermovirga sp.]